MKKKNLSIITLSLFICFIMFSFLSCKHSITQPEIEQSVRAPSQSLSASEIMKLQGISSIHFVQYDSLIVNGRPDSSFRVTDEYYIDTCRLKVTTYSADKHWSETVIDLSKNIEWFTQDGKLVPLFYEDKAKEYQKDIKIWLGSWLQGIVKYTGRKYLGDKLCDVFEDSYGCQEWVWITYQLPIQRTTYEKYDNFSRIICLQMRDIEINQKFPDGIFDPPK